MPSRSALGVARRWRTLLVLGGGLVPMGCAGARAGTEPTAPVAEERATSPRPPGIALDPVLGLPQAVVSAEPSAGLAVLAEPVDPEPARRVVRAFFEAVVVESTPDLERLVDRAAHTRPSNKARPEAALPSWRRRFDRLDYTTLGAEVFYRRAEMETRTARDAATPSSSGPLPAVPQGDDVVVRVPIVGQTAEKLFGPEVVFLLRKTAPRDRDDPARKSGGSAAPDTEGYGPYKIAELFEDFRVP